MRPFLEVKNLNVTYRGAKETKALHNVSFLLNQGECLGIVGESGSGKTTLAYSIVNVLPHSAQSEGKIIFDGDDLLTLNEQKLMRVRGAQIGIIFQEPAACFNPVLTIGYQFKEFLKVKLPSTDCEAIMSEYLQKAGLPQAQRILTSYPHQLSGGQLQRAMIAMAISTKPKLLIADEPTSSLDVTVESQIINLLQRLCRELGLTVLFITHNLGLVNILCDRAVVLSKGEVKEIATKEMLFKNPQDAYTKSLLEAYRIIGDQ